MRFFFGPALRWAPPPPAPPAPPPPPPPPHGAMCTRVTQASSSTPASSSSSVHSSDKMGPGLASPKAQAGKNSTKPFSSAFGLCAGVSMAAAHACRCSPGDAVCGSDGSRGTAGHQSRWRLGSDHWEEGGLEQQLRNPGFTYTCMQYIMPDATFLQAVTTVAPVHLSASPSPPP